MSSQEKPKISFFDLRYSLGSFLSVWAMLERELTKDTERLELKVSGNSNSATPHGVSRLFSRWKELNEPAMAKDERHQRVIEKLDGMFIEVLKVRNGLCHGLADQSGDSSQGEAYVTTEFSGEKVTYCYSELQRIMGKINCFAHILLQVSARGLEPKPSSRLDELKLEAHYFAVNERLDRANRHE